MTQKPEITTTPPQLPPGSRPDEILSTGTVDLSGMRVRYEYSSGRGYEALFYDDRLTFAQTDAPAPSVTLPYRARPLRDGQVLVHFLLPGRIGHVSLVIDLDAGVVYASGLIPGLVEQFDVARISALSGADQIANTGGN